MADNKISILVVDDELSIRESFSLILGKDFRVITAGSGEAALKKIIDEKVDLVYLDVRMPGISGIETLKRIKEIDHSLDVIMVTAVNDVSSATTAIKLGAKDYVIKPFDIKDIIHRTRSMVIKSQAKEIEPGGRSDLLGSSKQLKSLMKSVDEIIKKDVHIILSAEKGLECETIAGYIAAEMESPLVTLNISHDFMMWELFGCETGNYTEAFTKEVGALEKASNSVLFIRNVELLPDEAQIKLAACLLKKEMSREGSSSAISLNIRLICETSEDLRALSKKGLLNQQLLAVISGATIEVPPLRDREGDVPVIVEHLIRLMDIKYGKSKKISEEAMTILASYSWPGNIAELMNTIEVLMLTLDHDQIGPDDLPIDILIKSPISAGRLTTLDHIGTRFERQHILNTYNKSGHNKEKAAEMLGLQLKTLESKLESISA